MVNFFVSHCKSSTTDGSFAKVISFPSHLAWLPFLSLSECQPRLLTKDCPAEIQYGNICEGASEHFSVCQLFENFVEHELLKSSILSQSQRFQMLLAMVVAQTCTCSILSFFFLGGGGEVVGWVGKCGSFAFFVTELFQIPHAGVQRIGQIPWFWLN